MPQQGSVVNPMHLVNRLRGPARGQTWKINVTSTCSRGLRTSSSELRQAVHDVPALLAEVKTDTLHWNNREVACHVIEYREPGKEVPPAPGLRKRDGLVLQQEVESSRLRYDLWSGCRIERIDT